MDELLQKSTKIFLKEHPGKIPAEISKEIAGRISIEIAQKIAEETTGIALGEAATGNKIFKKNPVVPPGETPGVSSRGNSTETPEGNSGKPGENRGNFTNA